MLLKKFCPAACAGGLKDSARPILPRVAFKQANKKVALEQLRHVTEARRFGAPNFGEGRTLTRRKSPKIKRIRRCITRKDAFGLSLRDAMKKQVAAIHKHSNGWGAHLTDCPLLMNLGLTRFATRQKQPDLPMRISIPEHQLTKECTPKLGPLHGKQS